MPGSPDPGSSRADAPVGNAGQLPCPDVHLGKEYLRRLERFSLRFAAGLERREGAGRAGLLGAGEEYVTSRPYRPGEDLRHLDWDLLARLDRPYIRVSRREAAESWSLWIDTSASMGVGPPGKLQMAAEVAGGIAAAGLRDRKSTRLNSSHVVISYAVFCLKKKTNNSRQPSSVPYTW